MKTAWIGIVGLCIATGIGIFVYQRRETGEIEEAREVLQNRQLFSKLLGYGIWADLKMLREKVVLEDLIEGMLICDAGMEPPVDVNRYGTVDKIRRELQKELHENQMSVHLNQAKESLARIASEPQTVMLEDQKLYYQQIRPGNGEWRVEPAGHALFHYIITTSQNRELLNTYQEGLPKKVELSQVISGFARGVVGMRVGEKRKLYIHPDLGYRKSSWIVPAETLLIIEVEVIAPE